MLTRLCKERNVTSLCSCGFANKIGGLRESNLVVLEIGWEEQRPLVLIFHKLVSGSIPSNLILELFSYIIAIIY